VAKLRLSKFDKAVLELIRGGVYQTEHLVLKLHVDAAQFNSRMAELAAAGLVVIDDNGATVRLGIEGFNSLPDKKARRKTAAKKKETKLQAEAITAEAAPEPKLKREALPAPTAQKTIVEPLVTRPPLKLVVSSEEGMPVADDTNDLAELLRKGAPSGRQPRKQEPPIVRTEAKPLTKGGDEVCELCKAKFSLAVSGKGPAKFGHCFCGAAYHKDCYEAVMGGDKHCVRCGRKLELYLDKESEEAVHSIRDVFD